MKKICVLGLGYIGLPTAAILADNEQQVIGVDTNNELIIKLKNKEVFIEEIQLRNMIRRVIGNKNLQFSSTPEKSDVFIIAVPTPIKATKNCDLDYVIQAVKSILSVITEGNLIIIESTIPPGTCENVVKPLIENSGFIIGKNIFLAYCPERVIPGNIMNEIIENDRIVGGYTPECAWAASEIYRSFVSGSILITDTRIAEMVKLVENTFRDVNIALANEIMIICNRLKINVLDVIRLANKHPRVCIHQPGPGVGGHCLAVDPYFIIEKAADLTKIIAASRKVNNSMPDYILKKVKELMSRVKKAKIAVWGITYKGNVGDTRESPAIIIINLLIKEDFEVAVYDPYVSFENMENDRDNTVKDADLILILSDHSEFQDLDYKDIVKDMRTPIIFDTRNIIINTEKYSSSSGLETVIYNLGNIYESENPDNYIDME
jgi:UDP-N-acetyl-D-mannosaminuronic acid dehydrogenase